MNVYLTRAELARLLQLLDAAMANPSGESDYALLERLAEKLDGNRT